MLKEDAGTFDNPGGGASKDIEAVEQLPPEPLLRTQDEIGGEQNGLPNGCGGQNDGDKTGDSMFGLGGTINGGSC